MATQHLSFQQVAASYKENCKPFVEIAQGKKISMTQAIHEQIADFSDREKYHHKDIEKHILATDGLRTVTSGRNYASTIKEFKYAYQQNLLMDYWEKKYDRGFYRVPAMMKQNFEDASTLSGQTAGEAWRMYTDIQPKLAVLEPDIPMTAIVNFSVPSRSLAGRIPEITITNATPQEMSEGAAPKKGIVKFRKGSVEMEKAGILLEISRESDDNQDIGVDVVGMFMERSGVQDEIDIVNGLIKLVTAATVPARLNINVGNNELTGREILDIQSVFSRGKRADRVIGGKNRVLTYVDALSKAYVMQDRTTAGAAAISQLGLINAMSRPTLAGYLDGTDATDAGIADDKLYLIDSMNTLGVLTYQGDPYSAENFDTIRAVHQHVVTRWHAGFLQVDAPIATATFA